MTVQYSVIASYLKRRIYIFTLLTLGIFLFTPRAAHALRCLENGVNPGTGTIDAVTVNTVPANTPLGQVLWRSPTHTVELNCFQNINGSGPDIVHIYLNPGDYGLGMPSLNNDILWGVNINGTEYDLPSTGMYDYRVLTGFPEVPKCVNGHTDTDCKNETQRQQTMTFYVYAKKGPTASPGSNYQGPPSPFYIFNIDGIGGINWQTVSYRYGVTGINQIYFAACGATVNFSPGVVNLGTFFINRATPGTKAGEKNFEVVVQKGNCSDNFKLLAQFEPGSGTEQVDSESIGTKLSDGTNAGADAGIKLKFKRQSDNSYVQFGDVSDLADMAGEEYVIKVIPYTVEAFWTKSAPQLEAGNFSSSATITVLYN